MQRKTKYATLEESGHSKVRGGAMDDVDDGDVVEVDLEMSMTNGGTAGSAPADTRLETGGVLTLREAATAQDVGDDGDASSGTGHGAGYGDGSSSRVGVPTGSTPAPVPMTSTRPKPAPRSRPGRAPPAPTDDPCTYCCEELLMRPKIGNSYVVYTCRGGRRYSGSHGRSRGRGAHGSGGAVASSSAHSIGGGDDGDHLSRGGCQMIVGPHWGGLMYTATLISGSTVAFINNTASHMGAGHVALALSLCAASLCFLFLTGCSDPGIVRPGSALAEDAESARGRFCDVCQIHQPLGTYHCEDCNACIEELDHHCPWMGKCVGKRNMRWFQLFNLTWVVYLIFVLVVTFSDAAAQGST